MSNIHWVSKLIIKKKAKYLIHNFYINFMLKFVGYLNSLCFILFLNKGLVHQ